MRRFFGGLGIFRTHLIVTRLSSTTSLLPPIPTTSSLTSHAIASLEAVSRVAETRRRAGPGALQASGENDDVTMLYTVAARELLGPNGLSQISRWQLLADAIVIFGARARSLERMKLKSNHGDDIITANNVATAALNRATFLARTEKKLLSRDIFGLGRIVAASTKVREPCSNLLRVALPRLLSILDANFDTTKDNRIATLATISDLAAGAVLTLSPLAGGGGPLWGLNRHICASIDDIVKRSHSEEWTTNSHTRAAVRVRIGPSLITGAWVLTMSGALDPQGLKDDAKAVMSSVLLMNDLYKDEDSHVRCKLLSNNAAIGRLNGVLAGIHVASRSGRVPFLPKLSPALSERLKKWHEWAKLYATPSHAAIMMANAVKGPARRAGLMTQTLEFDGGHGIFVDLALTGFSLNNQYRQGFKGFAIEFDGKSHFIQANEEESGGNGGGGGGSISCRTLYKRWLLNDLGWAVIPIAWDEWANVARRGVDATERFMESKINDAILKEGERGKDIE